LNFAILEVVRLADADALTLEAVVFDPAAGHAQRQLVLVADAVGAAEAVVAEQRRVVEGVSLVSNTGMSSGPWDIQVEQARFQGLAIVLAEPRRVAVEVQAAVDAGDRYAAVLIAVEGAVEFLLSGLCSDLGLPVLSRSR
jgi:hypothetical protein